MSLLHLVILLPFLFAILVPFFYKYLRGIHTGWFVLLIPTVLFAYLIQFLPNMTNGPNVGDEEAIVATFPWVPSLGIDFTVYIDGLGLLFALLITGIGALVVLYSIYYLAKDKEVLHNFYVYLLMFMGAMLGVVLSDNLIVLYVFWEITSLSSSLLIGYWFHREKSRYGAQKSMLITVSGGFAMLAGFVLLYVMTGTFSIQEIIAQADIVLNHALFVPAMILILLGAFTKSAQFPFHIWLPDAMEAPTPVSAYLHSATMVKAGIYLVARLTPVFAGAAEWFWIVGGFGLLTLIWGSYSACKQVDLKAILAFSTVSQLGMIMCLLGIGSAAVHFDYFDDSGAFLESGMYATATLTAIFHLINHATFKGSLFMVAGIVDHETGTRDIRHLGGLMTLMPISFTLALIGTFSMAGLPPFNGFLSKEMFFTSMLNITSLDLFNADTWGVLFPVVAWIASVFTFLYSMIFLFRTFAGKYEPEKLELKPHEPPMGMLISPVILASLVLIFGIFPNLLSYSIIEPTMASIMPMLLEPGQSFVVHLEMWHGFNTELLMTIGVVALGTLAYVGSRKWRDMYDVLHQRDVLNGPYDYTLVGLIKGSDWITRAQMTGRLRDYLLFMMLFIIVLVGYTLFAYDAFAIDWIEVAPISPYFWLLAIPFAVGTLAVPFISHRITAIIVVGVVGFILALFFVIFRAPDLALTQLLIETVMVVLLLLTFYHLPELSKESSKPVFKWTNVLVSAGIGVIITAVAFSSLAMGGDLGFEPISTYYENAYELGGGRNMVNIILDDFRGLDTVLEVLVMGIAGLGVLTMIKLRMKEGEDV